MLCAASHIQCWPSCHLQMGQELHQAHYPSLSQHTYFFLILPLSSSQRQSLHTMDLLTKQAENVSQTCQLAGQLCCLPPWARLELRTGNLQVALVIQPSYCLIPHKQTPTPPSTPSPNTRIHTQPPPHPLCLQPTTQFCIFCSHWFDRGSLTTPPRGDRLAAVPFPGWPRARHSGI